MVRSCWWSEWSEDLYRFQVYISSFDILEMERERERQGEGDISTSRGNKRDRDREINMDDMINVIDSGSERESHTIYT